MRIKYNFGLLKGLDVGFIHEDNTRGFHGILQNVKKINGGYRFIYENHYIEISEDIFQNSLIELKDDILIFKPISEPIISGIFVFTMYDTYGFPMEITKEIIEEKGLKIDENGFNILKQVQKNKTKNTFKNKNAFERGEHISE